MACRLMSLITQSFARSSSPALPRPSTCTQRSLSLCLQSSLPLPQEECGEMVIVGWMCPHGQSWGRQLFLFVFATGFSMLSSRLIVELINLITQQSDHKNCHCSTKDSSLLLNLRFKRLFPIQNLSSHNWSKRYGLFDHTLITPKKYIENSKKGCGMCCIVSLQQNTLNSFADPPAYSFCWVIIS